MTYAYRPGSLAELAALLREPSKWPAGFVWNHRHPHMNAVGLAFQHWGGPHCYDDSNDDYVLQLALGLKCQIAICDKLLFTHHMMGQRTYKRWPFGKITPEMVAGAIEAHLGWASVSAVAQTPEVEHQPA